MRKKKIISVLLAASMVFATTLQGNGVITMADEPDSEVAVQTEAGVKSGTCGENLTWKLKDGTLTISGSGEMYNYYLLDGAPWYRETSAIDKIVIDENVKTIGDYAFYECSGLTSISIPDSVTSIGYSAFYECSSLTSINIPDSVTSIRDSAFESCSGLTSISIPDSVTSIGYYAFSGCSGLTSISIPDSVTSIGYSAFSGCSGLTSINIPDSVTSIGYRAFESCSGLTSISVESENTVYDSRNNCNAIIETVSNELIQGCQSTIIPDTVTSIGKYAFSGCSGLTSISIPDSVTSIGGFAFYGCSGLTSISIPDSVTSIGNSAFENCSGLTSISIPDSVTSIGNWAFSGCSSLTSISIPDSVTSIGWCAFYGCSGLTSINIPNGVTSIGNLAFYRCSSLTSISVESENTVYDSRNNCNAIIETVSNELIQGCQSTIIPNTVTSIGDSAFEGCSSLTSIGIPASVTSIGEDAFEGCSSLTSIIIPDSVTSIGEYAFEGCSSLTSIGIPASVTSIGKYAFEGCSSLTSISIPNSVTSIGKGAFKECSGLTSIYVPNSVTSIGDRAFEACDKLVICCDKGSYAESYAKKHNISYAEHMHNFETIITKAVTSTDPKKCTNAKKIIKCKECGFIKESNIICYYAKDIQLSSGSYTYDGKAKKPAVTVKDANGNVIAATNYKVTYSGNVNTGTGKVIVTMNKDSNYKGTITKTFTIAKASSKITGTTAYTKTARTKAQRFTLGVKATGGKLAYKSSNSKKVAVNNKGQVKIAANFSGKAVITVTARGANYKTATKKVTITVKPAATKLTRVKNIASKKATIKWTKLAYASGYQVQYSYKSNFKSAKSVTVSKASNVSKTIKKLVKNKTLHVRVRAYKTVGKTKLYGAWSAKKSVRIRK